LPDSNVIFFVAAKKTKQKKPWRGAWHVWLDITATSIQKGPSDSHTTLPLLLTRSLRSSTAPVEQESQLLRFSQLETTPNQALKGRIINSLNCRLKLSDRQKQTPHYFNAGFINNLRGAAVHSATPLMLFDLR